MSITDGLRRRDELPRFNTGTPKRRAASCPPADSVSLIAPILNSSVYCRLGSLLSRISFLHTCEVSNFLLYEKSRQDLFERMAIGSAWPRGEP